MEAWREELNQALTRGLGQDEDCDDFEEDFFLQMQAIVTNEI